MSLLTPIETIWAKPLPRNDPINIASWLEFRSYVRVKSLGMRQVGTKSESPEKTRWSFSVLIRSLTADCLSNSLRVKAHLLASDQTALISRLRAVCIILALVHSGMWRTLHRMLFRKFRTFICFNGFWQKSCEDKEKMIKRKKSSLQRSGSTPLPVHRILSKWICRHQGHLFYRLVPCRLGSAGLRSFP